MTYILGKNSVLQLIDGYGESEKAHITLADGSNTILNTDVYISHGGHRQLTPVVKSKDLPEWLQAQVRSDFDKENVGSDAIESFDQLEVKVQSYREMFYDPLVKVGDELKICMEISAYHEYNLGVITNIIIR